MSSGVSDQQMKPQGEQDVEEKHIPWSQQVAEELLDNQSSPTEGNSSATSSGGALFQYPPFNSNDNSVNQTNISYKSNHYENEDYNKGYGKPSYYNNSKKDDYNNPSWNSYHTKKSNINYDHRANKYNYSGDNYKINQRDVRRNSNDSSDIKSSNVTKTVTSEATKNNVQTSLPKKMTWASVASQPAKHATRPISTNSTLKKKGPGMPPPPMIPGKHNMDMLNTWDVGNSSPTPVPPSPPPVIPFSIAEKETTPIASNMNEDSSVVRKVDKPINSDNELSSQEQRQNRNSQSNLNHNVRNMGNNGDGLQHRPQWISQNQPNLSQHYRNINANVQNNKKYNHNHAGSYEGRNQYNFDKYQRYPSVNNDSDTNDTKTDFSESNPSTEVVPPNLDDSNRPVLDELKNKNNYNPVEINLKNAALARFFVIKSYSEDDVHRSIKYEIWCSTDRGNKRLDEAFREREKENGIVYLLFSVNGSGHFCGMAQMMTSVDYNSVSSVWAQDKWKGKFKVKWIYVKDVPNMELRNILLENNENKPVTYSRDAQEVPNAKGIQIIKILHSYRHQTSIFDDFNHYEKRQKEEISKKVEPLPLSQPKIMNNQNQSYRIYRQGEGEGDREKNIFHNKFSGGGFRDKNNFNRGGFHNNNFYDNRRNDYPRSGGSFESNQRDNRENNDSLHQSNYQNRENNDYNNRGSRYDYRSRDDRDNRAYPKHNNREQRDFHHDTNSGNGTFLHRGDNRNSGGFNKDSFSRDNDFHSRDNRARGSNHRN